MSSIFLPEGRGQLWLPGQGFVPPHIREAMEAVTDYDSGLQLARSEHDETWVVLWNDGPEGRHFPVFNLGRELPSRGEIQRRLYHADVRRRGAKIVADIERRNEARRKELRDAAHEAAVEVADTVDTAFHLMKRHPRPRIFVPS